MTGYLLSSNRSLTFRRAFAIQMEKGIHDPPLFEKSLIKERNEVALAELSRQLESGKERIALFYGAAHLPDLTDHLLTDFPTEKTEIRWLTAWKLD